MSRPLQTKTTVPTCAPNAVRRSAVEQILERGARVTSVIGAAGYGKTTAVAVWAGSLEVEVAWYSIDVIDDRPEVFWWNLTEAIGQVLPLTGNERGATADALRSSADAEGLLQAMGEEPADLIVVIDDLHLITRSSILDGLALFVERAPATMRFVLIARTQLRLPWGRWAVRELLTEASERDLAMDRMEATAVVRASAGESAADSAVDRAIDVAQGWPAALRLAGSALDVTGMERFTAATLAGDRHSVAFVVEEILDPLPAPLRRTVGELSLFDELDPRRCELFTGVADGRRLLDELVGRGLPISVVDPISGGHRMHPLVREVLAAELNHTRAAEIAELHVHAAEVEMAMGARANAVSHLIAAEEFESAFELAFTSVGEVYRTGRLCSMGAWIDRFPPEFVAGSADRCSAFALALAYLGRRDDAERWARMGSDRIDGESTGLDVASTRARVVAAIDRGDTETVRAEVAALRLRRGADEIDRDRDSQLHTAMAIASLVDERLDDAAYWVRSMVRWPDMAERLRTFGHPTRAAWEAFLRGSLAESAELAEHLLGEVGASRGAAPPVVAELYSLLATLALERLDLEPAAYWWSSALRRLNGRRACLHRFIIDRVAVAVIEARSGIEAAIRELRSAGEGAPPTLAVRYELLLAEFEARGGLRRSAAQRLEVLPPSPRKSLALARLALLADRPEIVRDTVNRLVGLPVALQIEAAILSALAAPGSREIERAIAIGAGEGYVWTYRREGAEVDRMLRDALAADPRWSASALAASLSSDAPDPGFIAAALTGAECRVLAFLPSHRSLPEIAAEMCLSVNTVKTHVRSIYAKLRVGTRSEAVQRATETGLLVTSPRA